MFKFKLNFFLSKRLSNSLQYSDMLRFSEYILNSLCCNRFFTDFFFSTKNIWFVGFHLVSFQMYYPLLVVRELLAALKYLLRSEYFSSFWLRLFYYWGYLDFKTIKIFLSSFKKSLCVLTIQYFLFYFIWIFLV